MFIFRSLAHRNFRLFFTGQILSLVGTWMQLTAMPWLVYRLTENPLWLGVVAFAGQLPALVVAPIAGVYSDRVNRHRLILLTQSLAMTQALLLTVLVLSDVVQVWHLIILSLVLSSINAIDLTARQAFLKELLDDPADLSNAIALNSAMFNSARLIGPALAGMVIALVGEGVCFLFNSLSYLAVIMALWAMRLPPTAVAVTQHASFWSGFREGLVAVASSPPILALMGLVALTSLFAVPYVMLMPVYVSTVLQAEALTNGLLLSSAGLGALTGSLYLATRRNTRELLPRLAICPLMAATSIFGLSISVNVMMAAVCVAGIGLSIVLMLASCNTLVQTIVDDDKRGRVMSLYTTAFLGLGPFGSLLAGTLAERFGVAVTLRLEAAICLMGGLTFVALVPYLRPIVDARLDSLAGADVRPTAL